MNITRIQINLVDPAPKNGHLLAYAAFVIDDQFVVSGLRIIRGNDREFVSMPSKKVIVHCPQCNESINLDSHFCSRCGARQPRDTRVQEANGRHTRDIAHPISQDFRRELERMLLAAYHQKLNAAHQPVEQ